MNESENDNLQWVAATDVDDYDDGASSSGEYSACLDLDEHNSLN